MPKTRTAVPAAVRKWLQEIIIRLLLNTMQLAAGMKGKANRAVAPVSEGGSRYGAIPL